jgi:hypothetical protein
MLTKTSVARRQTPTIMLRVLRRGIERPIVVRVSKGVEIKFPTFIP